MSDKEPKRHVVKWRSPAGKQYQILIPAKKRIETPQDFDMRVRWAQIKASEHEVGGDYIASLAEKHKGLSKTELINSAMIDLMDKIDSQQAYLDQLKKVEPSQHTKNLKEKAALDLMRYQGQKKSLQTFIATNPYAVEFAGEDGEGLSMYMDDKGMPQAAADLTLDTGKEVL